MIKQLLKAGALTAVAVSAAALPNAAQAARFQPLDLSGLETITGKSPGDLLLGSTPYFDEKRGQLGNFTVTFLGASNGNPNRPVGNSAGDLTLGTSQGGGLMTIRIDFMPLENLPGQFPIVKLTQTSAPAGTPSPSAFNPFHADGESYSSVAGSGGTITDWLFSPGTLAPGVTPDNSDFFVNQAGGTTAAWTFNNDALTDKADANTVPFRYDSNGTVGSLEITYSSTAEGINAATFNISTASEIPEPSTAIASAVGLGLGLLSLRRQR